MLASQDGAFFAFSPRDEAGATPLMLAVEANSPSMIKWLLDRGASPQAAMASGWRAVHLAVRLDHESCLLMFLQEVNKAEACGNGKSAFSKRKWCSAGPGADI